MKKKFLRFFILFSLSIFVFSSCLASFEVKGKKGNTKVKIKTEKKK